MTFYQQKHRTIKEGELEDRLLPLLREHVFHVTSHDHFRLIKKSSFVKSNSDGTLGNTYPQSARSLAREKGYVSLCDLRNRSDEVIARGLSCFYFLAPPPLGDDLVFLLLSPESYMRLLQWETLPCTTDPVEFRIPDIECWYPGDMPLYEINRALFVHVNRSVPPPDSLSARMGAALDELWSVRPPGD